MYFHGTYRFTVCCIFLIEWKTSLLPSSMIRFRSDLRPGFFQNSDIFVGGFTGWVFSLSGDRSVCQNCRSIQGSNIERLGLQNQCCIDARDGLVHGEICGSTLLRYFCSGSSTQKLTYSFNKQSLLKIEEDERHTLYTG